MQGRHARGRSQAAARGSGARHAKPQHGRWLGAGCGAALLGLVLAGQLVPAAPLSEQNAAVQKRLPPLASAVAALPPALTQSLDGALPTAPAGAAVPVPVGAALPVSSVPGSRGIPGTALSAYLRAAEREALRSPGCHLPWALLAGIGQVESGHAWGHGSEQPAWDGTARPPIYGPLLDGNGYAAVTDSDGGAVDGIASSDRAVGPMQFLPSTWLRWGVDADGSGRADPQNLSDAAAAAADYLCANGRDLTGADDLVGAVFSYNHSLDYVRTVLSAARDYGTADPGVITAALTVLPPPALPAAPPAPVVPTVPMVVASPPLALEPAAPPSHASAGPALSPSPSPSPSPMATPTPSATPGSAASVSPEPATPSVVSSS